MTLTQSVPVLADQAGITSSTQAGEGAGPITSGGGGYGSAVVSGVPEQLADRRGRLNPRCHGSRPTSVEILELVTLTTLSPETAPLPPRHVLNLFPPDGHLSPLQFLSRRQSGGGCATSGSRC